MFTCSLLWPWRSLERAKRSASLKRAKRSASLKRAKQSASLKRAERSASVPSPASGAQRIRGSRHPGLSRWVSAQQGVEAARHEAGGRRFRLGVVPREPADLPSGGERGAAPGRNKPPPDRVSQRNFLLSAPERIRTSDLRFRRPLLYPAEPRARVFKTNKPANRVAERAGFEPAVRVYGVHSLSRRAPSADSATSPRRAEEEGFEPPVRFTYGGFQDRCLRPLGHSSSAAKIVPGQAGSFRTVINSG